jgi:hypothetical protein
VPVTRARCAALWLAWLASLVGASAVHALGTPETFAPDARTLGLGHADAADDTGAALAHTNPGALSRALDGRVFVEQSLSLPALEIELEDAPDDPRLLPARAAPVTGTAFGFVIPMDIVEPGRLAFGVSAFFPSLVLIRARTHDPARPFFYRYDSQTEHYDISVALALNVFEWLSLGGGARLSAGQGGTIALGVDAVRGRLTTQAADTYQYAVFAPQAGVLLGPFGPAELAQARVGFVWREPTEFDVALPASLAFDGADVDALLGVLIQSNYAPRTAALGVSLDVVEQVRLNVDLVYQQWSMAPPPYLKANLDLSGETLEEAGLDDTLDAPAEGEERVRAPGFQDTLIVKVGLEGRFLHDVLALRAGYQLRPTPVPDQTSGTNIVDARAHVLAGGVGVRASLPALIDNPIEFHLGYQAQILEPRAADKESAADPVGNWRAGGVVHAVASGLSYSF